MGLTERGDEIVKVAPGSLSTKEAMELLMNEKRCAGCGTPLDFWGRYAKDYHASYCRYWVYQPVDSAVPVSSHERHTNKVEFRLSPRLELALDQLAEEEKTSVSEIVREALASRWGLK